MGTVHHMYTAAPGLTEAEVDAMIEDKIRAQADADLLRAQATAERAVRAAVLAATPATTATPHAAATRKTCPPCHGNCQGNCPPSDACPQRLQALVQADAQRSGLPTSPFWLALYAAVATAAAVASAFFPQPWGGA